jgi:hypothetical protein
MRKEATDRALRQQVPRDPAIRPFPQTRVPIAAGDDQVDVFVLDKPKQRIRHRHVCGPLPLDDGLDPVSGEATSLSRDKA